MKKILCAAVVSAAFVSSAASAQSNTDSVDLSVTATVQDECSIEQPDPVTFATVNINEGAGSNALLLKNGSQRDDQDIWISCNYAAKLTTTSTNDGLLNAAGAPLVANDPDDFTNLINYRVIFTSTDGVSGLNLDFRTRLEASDSVTPGGAFHDNTALRVVIDRDDTSKRPVAGVYTDTAVLTVGPV